MQEHIKIRVTIPIIRIQVNTIVKKYFEVQQTIQNVRVTYERTRDCKSTKVCTTCVKYIVIISSKCFQIAMLHK